MKIYKYTNAQGYTETITRIKLYDVMRYEDEDISRFLGCEICGACNDTVYSAYLIHISDSNDQAKVFYSYC